MEALGASSFPSFTHPLISKTIFEKPIIQIPLTQKLTSHVPVVLSKKGNLKSFTAISPTVLYTGESDYTSSPDQDSEAENEEEKFDWFAQWYPVMPICDLDKRRPHGKRVMGIDIVIWWDRNENKWIVFNDSCPHRLAPLSEGRIDQWGRLQCVYHGWCFGGSGDCKFIPQAPRDGPPVHTSLKACVAVYPSCVQNNILWFWASSDPLYKDILSKKKPPYIPELDDPSFTNTMICRDLPYGYEVLIENLMDPAHVPYAHYGIMKIPETPKSLKADREGGKPLEMTIEKLDINGFTSKQLLVNSYFIPPCMFYGAFSSGGVPSKKSPSSARTTEEPPSPVLMKKMFLLFYCIPVSPGNSRLILATSRNFGAWMQRFVPRWLFHIRQNLVLDSDLYLLHMEVNFDSFLVRINANVRGCIFTVHIFRILFRYWSHTVNCSSCNLAYKRLNALEIALQVISIASVGIVAAGKHGIMSAAVRNTLVSTAVLCFVASKWLSHFIYTTFRYHDYDHAFR
ncbi:protochlorophyllide-dependent translocon component 52, chloroplastic [Olea europaea var. sylvestris]|uniref:protochlorophyllide-dependent translocon component 52, chloroplastic n=1 Tax=Olea europaea var. sylvestris TaxID=158386 RepID=UPI000C1CF0B7|nr:protochlorophyllide-dependent translocon component 52, chloroplastic [Olea europaea var. sylvestris]